MNDADRIAELEIRLSFQDQLLGTLNDVVTEQGFRLQQLIRQLEDLRDTLARAGTPDDGVLLAPDERPPHY